MLNIYIFIALSLILLPVSAYAYLDPGTGSMLLTTLFALAATLFFSIKSIYYKGFSGIFAILGKKPKETSKADIIIYSEGKQYWNLFKPLCDEFEKRCINTLFLSSSEDDYIFSCNYKYIKSKYIGIGNRAYTYMNFIEAKICIMTTPGLDVLQIKRSKGVKHYTHVIHAPSDIHPYKLYSFDYYDSIFISGIHQEKSLRSLEGIRGTEEKDLINAGCLYYDTLLEKFSTTQKEKSNSSDGSITLLVAPSWGKNGLLIRYGISLLENILKTGINVILRPHPQSFISEEELIQSLERDLGKYDNLVWDRSNDYTESMLKSDILLSDFSGIVLDFAFLCEKPVLTMDFTFETLGFEADDIPHGHWGLSVFDTIGKKIKNEDIPQIADIIKKEAALSQYKEKIRDLRRDHVYNFGNTAPVVGEKIAEMLKHM